jgi:parallel beta-helix repeat protein
MGAEAVHSRRTLAAVVSTAALAWVVGIAPAGAQDEVTITVDTTSDVVDFGGAQTLADLPGPDGQTSLREAAIASTNTAGPETIAFDIPTSDPGFTGDGFVIRIDPASPSEQLTIGDDATTIDAMTQPGGFSITVEGGPQSISDSEVGLTITSSGNTLIGLRVRLYVSGIRVDGGSDNLVTGVTASSNRNGIQIAGRTVGTGNEIARGTASDNIGPGISITSTADVVVDGNTIVRNGSRGVFILFADEVNVTGNLIGENGFYGIEQGSGSGGSAAGNTITGNGSVGILITGGVFTDGFTITRNVIAGNGQLGINLLGGKEDSFGVTRNDAHDRDDGGNDLLNYPEIQGATDDGSATVVQGRVDFPEPQSLTLELYASDAPDSSGFGEGETFVGTATPDAKGRFAATLPAGLAGRWLTATATDSAGNTSEFSAAVRVGVPRK